MRKVLALSGGGRLARLTRFSAVGATGAIIYYLVLWALVEWMIAPVMLATSIAFVLVTAQNYLLHCFWTFDFDGLHIAALPRYCAMIVAGFCLNWGVMFAGVQLAEFHYLVVQVVAIAVVITWNVAVSNYWIFVGSKY